MSKVSDSNIALIVDLYFFGREIAMVNIGRMHVHSRTQNVIHNDYNVFLCERCSCQCLLKSHVTNVCHYNEYIGEPHLPIIAIVSYRQDYINKFW